VTDNVRITLAQRLRPSESNMNASSSIDESAEERCEMCDDASGLAGNHTAWQRIRDAGLTPTETLMAQVFVAVRHFARTITKPVAEWTDDDVIEYAKRLAAR